MKDKIRNKNNILTTFQLKICDKIQDTYLFLYSNAKAMLWRPTATNSSHVLSLFFSSF